MNIFDHELDPDSLRKIQIQFFNNVKSYVVKLSTYSTETTKLQRTHFVLQMPKISNPKSISRVRKKFPDAELSKHLDVLVQDTDKSTIFGQCRLKGDRSTYFKFCDCSLTDQGCYMELRLVIFGEVITATFDKALLNNPSDRAKSLFNFSVEAHEMDCVEDMNFHFDQLSNNETKKLSNLETTKLSKFVSKKGIKGDSPSPAFDVHYEPSEEIIDPTKEWIRSNWNSVNHYFSDKNQLHKRITAKLNRNRTFEQAITEIEMEARAS